MFNATKFSLMILGSSLIDPMALASTFVGNGGNIYEAELVLAQRGLLETIDTIQRSLEENTPYCVSPENQNGRYFEYLSGLNDSELSACQKFVKQTIGIYAKTLNLANIRLTDDPKIATRDAGPWRKIHAGASRETMTIVINQDDFVDMSSAERIMLLAHEIGHLVSYEGGYIDDDSVVAGMEGTDSGRQLLDTVGAYFASIAVQADVTPADPYRSSTVFDDHKVSLLFGERTYSWRKRGSNRLFNLASSTGSIIYSYQPGAYGLDISSLHAKRQRLIGEALLIHNANHWQIAARYRYLPFIESSSIKWRHWRHTQLILRLGLESLNYRYELRDNYNRIERSAAKISPVLGAEIAIPILSGFWLDSRLDCTVYNIKDNEFGININGPAWTRLLGVGYAF